MVCTANDLIGWDDFPKGLKVLLLDEDHRSATQMKSKLEEMDYTVSTFNNKDEALSAISCESQTFHVAIVEVNTSNGDEMLKFLEIVKDLPTIMTSNIHCVSTIMKCIALGAVEFLQKPLSDDKLSNIWQHVVHKAFSGGEKESVVSMLGLEKDEAHKEMCIKVEDSTMVEQTTLDPSTGSEKFPAPSTPQLKQGLRLVDDNDCQDQTNFSTERESGEQDVESKFVETTNTTNPIQELEKVDEVKDEHEAVDKSKDCSSNKTNDGQIQNSGSSKPSRKKIKVDWTPELHKKFVHAVEQLGVDQAIPSRILEIMKVEGLTRHNVASHLQKYRMHRRHILPKESAIRRWPNLREATERSYYQQKPVMAYPPYQSHHVPPANPAYPPWYPNNVNMWGPQYWPPPDNWHWRTAYPAIHADAWGCPVMPSPSGSCPPYPQNTYSNPVHQEMQTSVTMAPSKLYDFQPADEVIDMVVKEAMEASKKPWLPLPLGLKPPSIEHVLDELTKQGISISIRGSHLN